LAADFSLVLPQSGVLGNPGPWSQVFDVRLGVPKFYGTLKDVAFAVVDAPRQCRLM
jgi:hypothetical protein